MAFFMKYGFTPLFYPLNGTFLHIFSSENLEQQLPLTKGASLMKKILFIFLAAIFLSSLIAISCQPPYPFL